MKKTILCFGDSNTHGYNSQTDGRFSEEERWTCLLDEMLGTDYRVLEEGLSGRTICFDDPLFEGLNGFTSIFQAMMTHEPLDLLIIMLGTNDVKSRFHATPQNIAKGMERLLKKHSTQPKHGEISLTFSSLLLLRLSQNTDSRLSVAKWGKTVIQSLAH